MQDLIPLGQFVQIADHHFGRGLDLNSLLEGVIGFDVAAMQGLAIVTTMGIEGSNVLTFFDDTEVFQIGISGQQI